MGRTTIFGRSEADRQRSTDGLGPSAAAAAADALPEGN